jgi:hypothetical protein
MWCKYWRGAPIFTPHILPTTAIPGEPFYLCAK